jgi:hypothetical protein
MEEGQEDKITERIFVAAVKKVFDRCFDVDDIEGIALAFNEGLTVEIGEAATAADYASIVKRVAGLREAVKDLTTVRAEMPAAVEFVLEGLHLHELLNKYTVGHTASFSG